MILPITCPSCGEETEVELEAESVSNGDGVWAESGTAWFAVDFPACCVDMDFETLREAVEDKAIDAGADYVREPVMVGW